MSKFLRQTDPTIDPSTIEEIRFVRSRKGTVEAKYSCYRDVVPKMKTPRKDYGSSLSPKDKPAKSRMVVESNGGFMKVNPFRRSSISSIVNESSTTFKDQSEDDIIAVNPKRTPSAKKNGGEG